MKRLRITFLLCVMIAVIACSERQADTLSEQSNITPKATTSGYGKPAAPVTMSASYPPNIVPGEQFIITLQFESTTTAGSLLVQLSSADDLQIVGASRAKFELGESDMSFTTSLIGRSSNLEYLNIVVQEFDATGAPLMGRSFAVPIAIGANKEALLLKQQAERETDLKIIESEGERLIELPAQIE